MLSPCFWFLCTLLYGTLGYGDFHVDGRGLMYSYVLVVPFYILPFSFPPFLNGALIFHIHINLLWRLQSGGVGFLVGAIVCIVLLVLDGPAIAL